MFLFVLWITGSVDRCPRSPMGLSAKSEEADKVVHSLSTGLYTRIFIAITVTRDYKAFYDEEQTRSLQGTDPVW